MARNPPSQERLHLQPAAPLPSAMGKGKRKMTIDEYEEDRLSNNAKKPPTEGLLYLQPSTPMPLTPAPLPLSPLGGSLMATNATQMDFAPMEVPVDAPMEVPVDAPMEVPVDAPMDAQLEVPMDAPMEAPIDEVMRRDFQPILTRRQIAQRARRQREQGARILDNTQPLSRRQRQQCSRNDNTQRNLTSYTPPPSTPVLNTPSQSYSQRHESPIITSSYTPNQMSFSPVNPIRLFSTPSSPLQSQRRSPRISTSASTPRSLRTRASRTEVPEDQNSGSHDEDLFDMLIPDHNYEILPNTVRHTLGSMNVEWPFCKALHFIEERLSNSSKSRPRFGMCCLQGKIKLPL